MDKDDVITALFLTFFALTYVGLLAWQAWDSSPTQSRMENIDSVIIEGSDSKFIKFIEDGKIKEFYIEEIGSFKLSNKDFSYYSYSRPYYTLHLVEEDYQKIFKSVNKEGKDDLNDMENQKEYIYD